MVSLAFCYLYYHKFVEKADFYGPESSAGIYAVLKGIAVKPLQFRVLLPLIFISLKKILSLLHSVPDTGLYFAIIIGQCYFILLSFYFLLNKYFQNKTINCWLALSIIYPMIWNLVIMNGQFFYMDFGVLLIMILGFNFIVAERYGWLMVVFCVGLLNHPSVGYLIPAFLLYNYKKLFQKKTIIFTVLMAVLYIAVYKYLDYIYPSEGGYFVLFNLPRNLTLWHILPLHIIARDAFLNFGALHIFVLLFLFSGAWKKFRGPMLYVNLVIVPYVLSVLINFSIEEIRNYIAVIPFVIIPALLFLSSFNNTFLKLTDKVLYKGGI
jgi:hypothetical protein